MRDFEANDIIAPRDKIRDWIPWALVVHEVEGDGTVHAFPLGGGFEYVFDPIKIEAHDFVKIPAKFLDNPNWYSVDFFAEWFEKNYRGWTTGRRWNGWAMPYFEFEEAIRYAADSEGATVYDPERDAFITIQEGADEDEADIDTATVIKVRGRGPIKVYPIGAGSWTWEEAREEGEEKEEGDE